MYMCLSLCHQHSEMGKCFITRFYSIVIINLHIYTNVSNLKYEIESHYNTFCRNLNLINTKNLFFVIRINMIQREGSLNPPWIRHFLCVYYNPPKDFKDADAQQTNQIPA